jgi:hypothetical protein
MVAVQQLRDVKHQNLDIVRISGKLDASRTAIALKVDSTHASMMNNQEL